MTIDIFLDSGAWSNYTGRSNITLDTYSNFLATHADYFKEYSSLDVINKGEESYNNWVELKRRGFNSIPVFHANSDIKYLEEYLKYSDRIALGALARVPKQLRLWNLDYLWSKYLVNSEGLPKYKVHGFGLTDIDIMIRYPWYSVDSSTWIKHSCYGLILVPQQNLDSEPNFLGPINAISVSIVSERMYGGLESQFYYSKPIQEQLLIKNYIVNILKVPWGESEFIEVDVDYKLKKYERIVKEVELNGKQCENNSLFFPSDKKVAVNKKLIERIIKFGVTNYVDERIRANIRYYKFVLSKLPYPKRFVI